MGQVVFFSSISNIEILKHLYEELVFVQQDGVAEGEVFPELAVGALHGIQHAKELLGVAPHESDGIPCLVKVLNKMTDVVGGLR